jgi:nitrate reductase NapE
MTQDVGSEPKSASKSPRLRETITFLILAFGIWPIVAVGVVGGYGLAVWIWQMIFGPPGPPGVGH